MQVEEEEGGEKERPPRSVMMAAPISSRSTHGWLPIPPPAATSGQWKDLFVFVSLTKKKKKNPICIDIYQYFQQSAEGCDCGISHFRRCHSSGAGPRPSVRPGRGERMRRRRMGAGGCGPACAEVLTVATKSPRATPTKPWLLLFTTGKDHNKPCYILLSDGEREQTRKGQSSFLSFFFSSLGCHFQWLISKEPEAASNI